MIKGLRNLTLAIAATSLIGSAFAQTYSNSPHFEDPGAHSRFHATWMMEVRLYALEHIGDDVDELIDEASEGLETAVGMLAGTLGAADAALLERLEADLEAVSEAAEDGADLTDLLAAARATIEEVRSVVVPEGFAADPVSQATLLARLLLDDGGVAEGWEEAFDDETAEFAIGWAALQVSQGIWEGLEPLATENQAFEINDQMAFLHDELFATWHIPENVHLMDGEAAEPPTHRIVTFLEVMTDAYLYPNRDLASLVRLVEDLGVAACSAYGSDAAMGLEVMHQAFYYYDENLRRMVGLFDPELHEATEGYFEGIIDGDLAAAEACVPLQENLSSVRTLLGG